mgnify:CR=1 FL=1
MEKTAFDARYQEYLAAIEDYLNSLFAEKPHWADLYEAMRYSVLSGGKLVNKAFRILQQHILLPGKAGQAHGKITLIPERQKNAPAFLRRLFRGQDADVDSAGQLLRIPNQRHAVRRVDRLAHHLPASRKKARP